MLTQFITNVVVIDDNDADDQKAHVLDNLLSFLKKEDIAASHYYPVDLKENNIVFKKNRQLIFLDLHLDNSKDVKRNIQEEIRPLLKKILPADFGNYGIIMWTKYINDVELLKEKIQEDKLGNKYPTPLFIVGLDKMKYITAGNFSTLLADIENILKNDTAATFFLEWSNSVQYAQNITVSNIYSLMPDYKSQSDDIGFILYVLAKNHIGIHESQLNGYPLHIDAYKAFDDILHAELISCQKSDINIFSNPINPFSKIKELPKIYAQLNAAMFIDDNNITQDKIIPGNVYEQIYDNELLKIEGAPKKAKKIIIEITPPCDFSNRKGGNPRVVSGFMLECPNDKDSQDKYLKSFKGEAKYIIYPIKIANIETPQFICFDFRYTTAITKQDLIDNNKYKILFRTKPKLFADILQKFSSHAARLGLSVIHS